METTSNPRMPLPCARIVDMFMAWLREDGHDLVSSAELLGGDFWKDLAREVVEAVERGARIEDVDDELRQLHRLLSLEFVDDLSSVEAGRFLSVHPDDPRADLARLCAEALEKGLDAFDRQSPSERSEGDAREAA